MNGTIYHTSNGYGNVVMAIATVLVLVAAKAIPLLMTVTTNNTQSRFTAKKTMSQFIFIIQPFWVSSTTKPQKDCSVCHSSIVSFPFSLYSFLFSLEFSLNSFSFSITFLFLLCTRSHFHLHLNFHSTHFQFNCRLTHFTFILVPLTSITNLLNYSISFIIFILLLPISICIPHVSIWILILPISIFILLNR